MQTQTSQALENSLYAYIPLEIGSAPLDFEELEFQDLDLMGPDVEEFEMRKTLQIGSLFLEYPDSIEFSYDEIFKDLINPLVRGTLQRFWDIFQETDPIERAEHYVSLFDLNSLTSLYLTSSMRTGNGNKNRNWNGYKFENENVNLNLNENVNENTIENANESETGKDTDQGMALIRFKEIYKKSGFALKSVQLPDYLPLFLEFLSIAPLPIIHRELKIYQPSIKRLASELHKVESPYALILDACLISFSALLAKEVSV